MAQPVSPWSHRSPFLLLATSGAAGRGDVSPKGDTAGFVLVLDERLGLGKRISAVVALAGAALVATGS